MAYEACIKKVGEYLKGTLSEKEVQSVIKELERRVAGARQGLMRAKVSEAELPDILLKEGSRIADDLIRQAKKKKRADLQTMKAKNARRLHLKQLIDANNGNIGKGIKAKIVGTVYSGQSVSAQQRTLHKKTLAAFANDLEKAGVLKLSQQNSFMPLIARELAELNKGLNGKTGITKNIEALTTAKIFKKHLDYIKKLQNDNGADIGDLFGWMGTQTHNRKLIKKAGYENWKAGILKHIDFEKTFKGGDPDMFLKAAYSDILTGENLKNIGAYADSNINIPGYTNLAEKVSASRQIHFKGVDDWFAYNNAYGKGTFFESIINTIQSGADNAILMYNYGANPEAQFNADFAWLKKEYKDDPEKINEIQDSQWWAKHYFAQVTGEAQLAIGNKMAAIGSSIRIWNNVTALGGVFISSLPDIAGRTSEIMRQQGGNKFAKAYADVVTNLMKGKKGRERRDIAASVGAGYDGMIGAMISKITDTDSLPGMLAKMQTTFYKINLLNWWTDVNEIGAATGMANWLANISDLTYDQLYKNQRALFEKYEINAADWDIIRTTKRTLEDGRDYITPDLIKDLDDSLFKNADEKFVLELKLSTYFNERIEMAPLEPGAAERSYATLGTRRGTLEGEFFRLFMQFKQYPMTVITKILNEDIRGRGGVNVPVLINWAVAGTMLGIIANTLSDISKGLEPRDIEDPKTLAAGFVRGGGAGILGDFFFGDYNRYGHDFWVSTMGISFAKARNITSLYGEAIKQISEGESDLAAKSVKVLIENTPGNNLFYLRGALNYWFVYALQEELNPGYLNRMQKNRLKETGQQYIYPPSQYAR